MAQSSPRRRSVARKISLLSITLKDLLISLDSIFILRDRVSPANTRNIAVIPRKKNLQKFRRRPATRLRTSMVIGDAVSSSAT